MGSDDQRTLTHTDADGTARMVDVSGKQITHRQARAEAFVRLSAATLRLCETNALSKGDVIPVARIAGIQGAKQTPLLIPLCHGLALDHIDLDFRFSQDPSGLSIRATATCHGKTGVEMEAMTAVSVAALAVYDMVKGVERGVTIEQVGLVEKIGGKNGHWTKNIR